MATIPSFEAVLLEIYQSLNQGSYRSETKRDFADLGLNLDNHRNKAEEILDAIIRALDMDAHACRDATRNMMDWASFNKALELHTWTSNADQRQVLWHLLAYSYVPGLARWVANWNLQGAFDKGMPGGEFWFLPHRDESTRNIRLPVPAVVEWLLDLLGSPMDQAKSELGGQRAQRADTHDSIERNLYNWKAGSLPSAQTIGAYFPDEATPNFQGVFQLADGLPEEVRFAHALDFARKVKNLDAEELRGQVPMTQPGRLEAVLDGSASAEEQELFVDLLLERYAQPTMRIVRQRLLVARMVQDGYQRLLDFLCPGVDKLCANPHENKILQLVGIFGTIYNLTVGAWKNCHSEPEENAWFESRLAPWDKASLFISILPSNREHAHLELAALLTRRFAKLTTGAPLEDVAGLDQASALAIATAKIQRLAEESEEDECVANILWRIRRGCPPQKAFQPESSFTVVSQAASDPGLSPKALRLAIARLKELAHTEDEKLWAISIELGSLLNCGSGERPKDVQQRVSALLTEAESSSAWNNWKAPMLQYRAKHRLAQNDFDGVAKDFRDALEASRERNSGTLRGEIARDGFACAVADQRLIPENHEKYYRNMLAYLEFDRPLSSIEDEAVDLAEYFWSDLYKPYSGFENRAPLATKQAEVFIKDSMGLLMAGDWDGLRAWMKRHAKAFKVTRIREARGNTVLMAWLKLRNTMGQPYSTMKVTAPAHLRGEVAKFGVFLENWRTAIAILVEGWPEQVNLPDFKRQTPLMLTADAGDEFLVKAFLNAGADIDTQDYRGRTALHAAVTGRSEACVEALLEKNPDTSKVTVDEHQTALHTAVRMGHPDIVERLLTHDPSLKLKENIHGQTPLALAEDVLENLANFREGMARHKRQIGSRQDFEEIIALLKKEPTIH